MTTDGATVDFCVVGGGIVGLATAMTLLERRPGSSLVLLEKEEQLAQHQTGHNSGVVHAGIYYTPGSLKARLCKAGARWVKDFCRAHDIRFEQTGKLIVATNAMELERLAALEERARLNQLTCERLDANGLRHREPHIRGVGALFLADTGIVDFVAVGRAMGERIRDAGGEIRLKANVVGIEEEPTAVRVAVKDGEAVRASHVVVCGGIQADRLARMAGIGDGFAMVPFRGEYYRLPASRDGLINTLIYPVPDPALPFLGVHLTLTVDGGITVGPNAVLGMAREGYPKFSFNRQDVADLVRFSGFWRLARTQVRTGAAELWNSVVKAGYLQQVRRYCPELQLRDLMPEPAGIRAQAVLSDGRMVEDFMFRQTARQLHVINAPSPAATSSMPIAAEISDVLLGSG